MQIQMDAGNTNRLYPGVSASPGIIRIYGCVAEVPLTWINKHFCKVILDPRQWKDFPWDTDPTEKQEADREATKKGAKQDTGEDSATTQPRHPLPPRTYSWWEILTPKSRATRQDQLNTHELPLDTVHILPLFQGGYNKTLQAQYCLILCPAKAASPSGMEGPRLRTETGSFIFHRVGLLVIEEASRDFCLDSSQRCRDPRCIERAREKMMQAEGWLGVDPPQLDCIGDLQTIALI